MALDFPNNPDNGQLFQPGEGLPTYVWNGVAWVAWPTEAPTEAPLDGQVYGRQDAGWTDLAGMFAPSDSPTFTGDPKAPTPDPGDNDTSIATTAFVQAAITAGGGFPEAPLDGHLYARSMAGWNDLIDEFAAKASSVHTHVIADVTDLPPALAALAPLNAPVFTGDPRAPNPTPTDNDTSIATTAWVNAAIAAAVTAGGGFPEAPNDGGYYARRNLAWSNTVGVFAPAVHVHVIADTTDLQSTLDTKAPLNNPHFAGIPTAPTAGDGTYTTQLATTQFVGTAVAQAGVAKANIDSPTFTGNPKAPTPLPGDADTSIATTAFVMAAVSSPAALPPFIPFPASNDSTTDWDTITTAGWGNILLGLGNPHAPVASAYFFCQVLNFGGNLTQVAIPYGQQASLNYGMYTRGKYAGTWTPWMSVGGVIGSIIYVPANVPPPNYVKINGVLLDRSAYALLWAYAQASGNIVAEASWAANRAAFSPGDGSTNFRIPDDRGVFIRGWDDGRTIDSGRTLDSIQADTYKNHTHTADALPTHNHTTVTTFAATGGSGTAVARTSTGVTSTGVAGATNGVSAGTPSINDSTTGGTETRPINNARLACIRYQ